MEVATITWPGGRGLAAVWTTSKSYRPHENLRLWSCEDDAEVEEYPLFLNHSKGTSSDVLRETLKKVCEDRLIDLAAIPATNGEARLSWREWKLEGKFDPGLLRLMASPSGLRLVEHLDRCPSLPQELLTPIWATLQFARMQPGFLFTLKEDMTRG